MATVKLEDSPYFTDQVQINAVKKVTADPSSGVVVAQLVFNTNTKELNVISEVNGSGEPTLLEIFVAGISQVGLTNLAAATIEAFLDLRGSPTSVKKGQVLTQAQYDALGVKAADTIYFITA